MDELESLIIGLESQSVQGQDNTLKEAQKYAATKGLSPKRILEVVKMCTNKDTHPSLACNLVKLLIPDTYIPEEAVICALLRISTGICPYKTQNVLLKWIVAKFSVINPKSDMYSLMPMLCNLRNHEGLEDSISQLLNLMINDGGTSNCEQLLECQRRFYASQRHNFRPLMKFATQKSSFQWSRILTRGKVKTQKFSEDNYCTMIFKNTNSPSEKLEASPLSQRHHAMAVMPLGSIKPHLQLWLHQHLFSMYCGVSQNNKESDNLLNHILMVEDLLQCCRDVWVPFTLDFIRTWNGYEYRDIFLKFLTNLPIQVFLDFRDEILNVLQKLFQLSDINFKYATVMTLTDMICKHIDERKTEALYRGADAHLSIELVVKFVENTVLENMLIDSENSTLIYILFEFWEFLSIYAKHYGPFTMSPFFVKKAFLSCSAEHLNSLYRILDNQTFKINITEISNSLIKIARKYYSHESIDVPSLMSPYKHQAVQLIVSQCSGIFDDPVAQKSYIQSEGLSGAIKLLQSLMRAGKKASF